LIWSRSTEYAHTWSPPQHRFQEFSKVSVSTGMANEDRLGHSEVRLLFCSLSLLAGLQPSRLNGFLCCYQNPPASLHIVDMGASHQLRETHDMSVFRSKCLLEKGHRLCLPSCELFAGKSWGTLGHEAASRMCPQNLVGLRYESVYLAEFGKGWGHWGQSRAVRINRLGRTKARTNTTSGPIVTRGSTKLPRRYVRDKWPL
jgi:hypothetical protein